MTHTQSPEVVATEFHYKILDMFRYYKKTRASHDWEDRGQYFENLLKEVVGEQINVEYLEDQEPLNKYTFNCETSNNGYLIETFIQVDDFSRFEVLETVVKKSGDEDEGGDVAHEIRYDRMDLDHVVGLSDEDYEKGKSSAFKKLFA